MSNLYVTEQGSLIRKSGLSVVVEKDGETLLEAESHRLDTIVLFGNVQVTSQCLRQLLKNGTELALMSMGGQIYGQLTPRLLRVQGPMNNLVVCYDIADDKQRAAAAKLLDGYGNRVQESVFELAGLKKDVWTSCLTQLKGRISLGKGDSIRIYSLCEACRVRTIVIGHGPDPMEAPDRYVI